MIPTPESPLRVVAMNVVVDVDGTSRFVGGSGHSDTAQITASLVLEKTDGDLAFPVRVSAGRRADVTLLGGDQVVRVRSEVVVAPDPDGDYKLEIRVPDISELIEIVEGSPVAVLVLLPSSPEVALVSWSQEKPATVYGTERLDSPDAAGFQEPREPIAGRIGVAWQFDRDPTLDVVWRYVGTGSPNG